MSSTANVPVNPNAAVQPAMPTAAAASADASTLNQQAAASGLPPSIPMAVPVQEVKPAQATTLEQPKTVTTQSGVIQSHQGTQAQSVMVVTNERERYQTECPHCHQQVLTDVDRRVSE